MPSEKRKVVDADYLERARREALRRDYEIDLQRLRESRSGER
jgi:hypothetical protein